MCFIITFSSIVIRFKSNISVSFLGLPLDSLFEEVASRDPLFLFISFCGETLLLLLSVHVLFLTEDRLWFAVCVLPVIVLTPSASPWLVEFCIELDFRLSWWCCCDRCIWLPILDDVVSKEDDEVEVVVSSGSWPKVFEGWACIKDC